MSETTGETTKVRFGMAATRELEIEVEPGHNIAAEFEAAAGNGSQILWVLDTRGHRHGIVLEKVAFVEIESARRRDVGFSGDS
ncbi:MAG TPA: DUF3107 family protein [Acidimicrobiia bacterium]|nr:DUF3107 family protein [Acidimicrobiia bacterium]